MPPKNPMTEGEALAVDVGALHDAAKFLAGRYSDHDGWVVAIRAAASALTAHTAASGGEVVAERHQLYGIRWIKQLREMEPGTQWFIEGRSAPIATVLSSAGVQWHTAESEIPHGTKYYTRPPAAVPADALERLVEKWRADKVDDAHSTSQWDQGYAYGRSESADELAALIPKGVDHG